MTSTINFSTSYGNKGTGANQSNTLTAKEWNGLMSDLNTMVGEIPTSSGSSSSSDPHIVFDSTDKHNLTILTTAEDQYTLNNKTKGGKINIEPVSDLQIKSGDDISFYAHHRAEGDKNQVLIKILTEDNSEDEIPANLKLNTGDITITNKDNIVAVMVEVKSSYKKTPDYEIATDLPANTFTSGNIYKGTEITSKLSGINNSSTIIADILGAGIGKTRVIKYTDGTTNTFYKFTKVSNADGVTNISFEDAEGMGYLKVRAQAIDLRCEDHGGIALLPKGEDGQGHMNKIKFEHGGGDGLEFGTFNTEKTSIFTDEYRFNKDGVWKMATRQTEASDKADVNDPTTALKYVKQLDDFYDIIDTNDAQCTTRDIIKTAAALNGQGCVHTHITSKGDLEIETSSKFSVRVIDSDSEAIGSYTEVSSLLAEGFYTAEELNTWLGSIVVSDSDSSHDIWVIPSGGSRYYEYTMEKVAPSINIESANKLKLAGELDFGSRFNFGETDNGIEVQNKYTNDGTLKDCGKLKVVAVNNNSSAHTFNTLWDPTANSNAGGSITETTISVPAGESAQIAEASIYDIIKLVNYMKDNNQGPWANNL